MPEAWFQFIILIFVQFLLFFVHARYEKSHYALLRTIGEGMLIGIILGVPTDLVLGKYIGFYSYDLGFGIPFLVINGAFSYGLMAANTLLMQRVRLPHFFFWAIFLMMVYEVTNTLSRVWTWQLPLPPFPFVAVIAGLYFGCALLIAIVWHHFYRREFRFVSKILKRA